MFLCNFWTFADLIHTLNLWIKDLITYSLVLIIVLSLDILRLIVNASTIMVLCAWYWLHKNQSIEIRPLPEYLQEICMEENMKVT